jgi:hypothetical protein
LEHCIPDFLWFIRMVFEHIEQLKRKWTDKYVVVDESRPELQRFSGQTGTVKTVNFSGRALVQFDGNNNIGWFDIDPRFLKVIDAPLPKPVKEEKKTEKKPAPAKSEAAPAEKAAPKPAAKAGGASASVADILAAARGKAAPKTEATPQPAAAPPAAKAEPGKMSTADILAMARGKKAAEAPPAAEKAPVAAKPVATPAPEPPAPAVVESAAVATPKQATSGAKPKDTAGIVAYCRKIDGK